MEQRNYLIFSFIWFSFNGIFPFKFKLKKEPLHTEIIINIESMLTVALLFIIDNYSNCSTSCNLFLAAIIIPANFVLARACYIAGKWLTITLSLIRTCNRNIYVHMTKRFNEYESERASARACFTKADTSCCGFKHRIELYSVVVITMAVMVVQ